MSPTHEAIAAFVGRISIVGPGNSGRHQVATMLLRLCH